MNYIVGLAIAIGAIHLSLVHLEQSPMRYWDLVAFAMVIGGTVAVSIIILPWSYFKELFKAFFKIAFSQGKNKGSFLLKCVNSLEAQTLGRPQVDFDTSRFEELLLKDGYEFIRLGFSSDKIQTILEERIYHIESTRAKIANGIMSLAKYPPAFGLAGTVFGLVELMRAVTEGLPAQETGLKMATALVATMYGLLVANLFVNPAGELLKKIYQEENKLNEIALHTILLAAEQTNLLEAQELLNSHVKLGDRVNLMAQAYDDGVAA